MSTFDDSASPASQVPGPGTDHAAAASLAGSLSTVGYAMFALLQPGPLDEIQPMAEVAARLLAPEPDSPQPENGASARESGVSSGPSLARLAADFDDDMVPSPPAPANVPSTPPFSAGEDPNYAVFDDVIAADEEVETRAETPAAGRSTLALLQEISFLDE